MSEVSTWTERYAKFRRSNTLQQGVWQTKESRRVVACALGAFLDVEDDFEASQKACATSQMPDWLVELTPEFFDHTYVTRNYHIKWADELYMPGGIIDRANKLTKRKREALYKHAEKEIRKRYECAGMELPPWADPEDIREMSFDELLTSVDEKYAERIAGTIPTVLDELLTKAGV